MSETVSKNVVFFGASYIEGGVRSSEWKQAFHFGRLVATNGFTLVCGAGPGLMQAAVEGALDANGNVIGVTWEKNPPAYGGFSDVIHFRADQYNERMVHLVTMDCCAQVAGPGATGTLEEIAMSVRMRTYGGVNPIAPLIAWNKPWKHIGRVLSDITAMGVAHTPVGNLLTLVDNEQQAFEAVKRGHTQLRLAAERAS